MPMTLTAQPAGPLAKLASGQSGVLTVATPVSADIAVRRRTALPCRVPVTTFMFSVSSYSVALPALATAGTPARARPAKPITATSLLVIALIALSCGRRPLIASRGFVVPAAAGDPEESKGGTKPDAVCVRSGTLREKPDSRTPVDAVGAGDSLPIGHD